MNKEFLQVGDVVTFSLDGLKYRVLYVTKTAGTPSEVFYTFALIGRWFWQNAITHTLPHGYVVENFTKTK